MCSIHSQSSEQALLLVTRRFTWNGENIWNSIQWKLFGNCFPIEGFAYCALYRGGQSEFQQMYSDPNGPCTLASDSLVIDEASLLLSFLIV